MSHILGFTSFDDEFKFITLYSPDEINAWGTSIKFSDFEIWLSAIVRYIKMYPLILACSFVNQSGKVPYKQEYIIPQMLMQWVQRNSDFAQGISYFTCTDTTTQTSMWCAYNIVIPALPPFDAQKYSSTLREHFCWSLPQYFIAPIADTQRNKDDRRFIYDFLSNIRSATRMYIFPTALHNHLIKIMNICCSLLSLLDNGNSINLELALHMLDTLYTNYQNLKKENIESMIELAENNKTDSAFNSNQKIEDVFRAFKDICSDFFAEQKGKNSIEKLIEKYKWISRNDFHLHSEMEIISSDPSTIRDAIEWCNKNHLLHRQTQLKADEASLKYLENICSKFGFPLSDFWDTYMDDTTWMKENIASIKYPIIIKHDDTGVYSPKEYTSNEFCQIGFNKDELSKLLKKL